MVSMSTYQLLTEVKIRDTTASKNLSLESLIAIPRGNMMPITSPIILPMAAPILKVGITTPEGTGRVRARMEAMKL